MAKAIVAALGLLMAVQWATSPVNAQAPFSQTPPAADGGADLEAGNGDLATRQRRLAEKYARLEELLSRISQFETSTNPRRATLLKQAFKQSRDSGTQKDLAAIVDMLTNEVWKPAEKAQSDAKTEMKALLDLLLSEDRSDRLKSEQQRIKEYIKELERLKKLQAANRGRNEGGANPTDLAKDQEKIAERTGELEQKIAENEGADEGGGEGANGQGSAGQNKSEQQDGQKGDPSGKPPGENQGQGDKSKNQEDSKPGEQRNAKAESKPAPEGQDGEKPSQPDGENKSHPDSKEQDESGDKKEGDSQSESGGDSPAKKPNSQGGQQGGSQGGGQQDSENDESQDNNGQQQDEFPARKRIQEAEQKMREAKQKLEEAKRNESIEAQRDAEEKLKEAIAELEEILRQLREEEVERMLALLEGRFRKMLEMELRVYESTKRLDKIPAAERTRDVDIQAGKLGFDQRKIVVEADRALTLLLEEGSSIAFPETVQQMRDDMQQVADRLTAVKVDGITQGIEEDIIQALEEIIESLQQAQQDQKDNQQQNSQQNMAGQPQEQPLVDQIAELKMIRALQMRVNTRTDRYAQLLDDIDDPKGQATDDELLQALNRLAEREQRVHRITRDIVLGKNR
jgi:hypothetical protein